MKNKKNNSLKNIIIAIIVIALGIIIINVVTSDVFSIMPIVILAIIVICVVTIIDKKSKGSQNDKKYDDKPNVIRPKTQKTSFINISGNRMVTCSTCGNKVDYNNSNCPRCKEQLKVICRCCGNENKVDGPMCPDCGKDLTSK